VRDGLKLSKLGVEHPMLTLIELIYVKKKHEKLTLACKGDTLPNHLTQKCVCFFLPMGCQMVKIL
jgi:hypothetical protein